MARGFYFVFPDEYNHMNLFCLETKKTINLTDADAQVNRIHCAHVAEDFSELICFDGEGHGDFIPMV